MKNRNLRTLIVPVAVGALCVALGGHAFADDTNAIAVVKVGDAGNKDDGTGFGAVAYEYKIGKYEVTWKEFCEFLNGVAKTDTHHLYESRMADEGDYPGGITRSGEAGSCTYTVKTGWEKKPVGFVTWETCIRFANWLTNGKGKGDTETGSYTIKDNVVKLPDHAVLAAGKTTNWVVASESEWYKAGYYDPKKTGGAGYWTYPVKSDSPPEASIGNGAPTDVGSYTNAVSAYGTLDQAGNVWEYMENRTDGKVGLRGGSWHINDNDNYERSSTRYDVLSAKWPHYGFRVVALGGAAAK